MSELEQKIKDLTVAELNELKDIIEVVIERRKREEIAELRRQIDDLLGNSGITLEEIQNAKAPSKIVRPKYRNPEDPSQTWTGRGRRPTWLDQKISSGRELDEFLIPEDQQ
ncbi:MAG: H-NS histone family protein [Thiofilum sp.]|uniref:H-NS histone family protein n=1 Tax=Thiofilum sp. TaxID=2212733 RepID=UPI0025F6A1C8|nr:H-NS histone family protein [Thiofilum sp.]MBK8451963.1 H-NS histone family protein [Thiofilum sp.]